MTEYQIVPAESGFTFIETPTSGDPEVVIPFPTRHEARRHLIHRLCTFTDAEMEEWMRDRARSYEYE